MASPGSSQARPYRSHRIPACDLCHRRKSRCHRVRLDEPCILCLSQNRRCIPRVTSHVRQRSETIAIAQDRSSWRVQNVSTDGTPGTASSGSIHPEPRKEPNRQSVDPLFATTATGGHSSHIVGPAVASDVQMLDQYLSPQKDGAVSHVHPNPYSIYSDDPRNPVVYLKVPKQRSQSSTGNGTTGFKEWQIMENILRPMGPKVLDL